MDCGWAGNEIPMRESAKGIQLYHELADEVRTQPTSLFISKHV